MSNNKTAVPGMGNSFGLPNSQGPVTAPIGATQNQDYRGTCFPGMNQGAPSVQGDAHKPIMGFLYSVSRTANGEYWPLYLGLNTIGRGTSCSVRLQEGMITDNHAELVIRTMKNPDRIMAFIKDSASTCGTMLNGTSLGFEPQECHNGDIITIGEHYELYLILVDAKSMGLSVNKDFIPVDGGLQSSFSVPSSPWATPGATSFMGQPQGSPQMSNYMQSPGYHGQQSVPQPQSQSAGGTVVMEGLKR